MVVTDYRPRSEALYRRMRVSVVYLPFWLLFYLGGALIKENKSKNSYNELYSKPYHYGICDVDHCTS
ncbi:Uncharacterised protein [uncultured archaeon]|nr:Uncharacterised protein [uncultured archaeon]